MTTTRSAPIGDGNCRNRVRWGRFFGLMLFLLGSFSSGAHFIERQLPESFFAETPFEVVVLALPDGGTQMVILEEQLPPNWAVSRISHFGVYDAAHHKIKWGPFFDDAARRFTYDVTPDRESISVVRFDGIAWFDQESVSITGADIVVPLTSEATRLLPATYTPAIPAFVQVLLRPAPLVRVQAVEEQLPAGWSVTGISHGGIWDAIRSRIKWGPFHDGAPRNLSYTTTPSRTDPGEKIFTGRAYFDAMEIPILGGRTSSPVKSLVTRIMPGLFLPGISLLVSNRVAPHTAVQVYAVEEMVPTNWVVSALSHSGVFDPRSNRIRWGPFTDNTVRTLSYSISPPANEARQAVSFSGFGLFDQTAELTTGSNQVTCLQSVISRTLPVAYVGGVTFQVIDAVRPAAAVRSYAVEEPIPVGWLVTDISNSGVFDPILGRIKWGPFLDRNSRDLRFRLTPPVGANQSVSFTGTGYFDNRLVSVGGATELSAALNTAVRQLPSAYRPSQPFSVLLRFVPINSVRAYSVEETVPVGWQVSNITQGGVFDEVTSRLKWGPFTDHTTRSISYRVTPPLDARGAMIFEGLAAFDTTLVSVGGSNLIQRAINTLPVADSQAVTLLENTSAAITLTGSSIHTQVLAFVIESRPKNGRLSGSVPNLTYIPQTHFNGTDSFTFRVNDGIASSAPATVSLLVTAVNNAPGITDVPDQTIPQDLSSRAIPFVVSDLDSAASSLSVAAATSDPALIPPSGIVLSGKGPNRRVDITPAPGKSGVATITLTVTDPDGLTAEDTFLITVIPPIITTFTNATSVAIPSVGPATPYPSTIGVSNVSGTVLKAVVDLKGITHANPDDIDVLLVGPGGQKVLLMADAGGTADITGIDLTLDDAAAARLPDGTLISAGRFRPSNFSGSDTFPSPAPAAPYSANLGILEGIVPNGSWSLFVVDDLASNSGRIEGGWSLTLTARANSPPFVSELTNKTVIQDSSAITIPFTIGDVETAPANLVVLATANNPALLPASNLILGGSGANRNLRITSAPRQFGTAIVRVTVTDLQGSQAEGIFEYTVTPLVTNQVNNPAAIVIPMNGPATPYPSSIVTSGLDGVLVDVSVVLRGLSHTAPTHLDMLLVGPGGQRVLIMSDAGGTADLVGVNLTLSDSATASLPNGGQIVNGTFRPTNFGTGDTFPGPAPAQPYATTLSSFKGPSPNGTWSLYIVDDQANESGVLAGGWGLSIVTTPGSPAGSSALAGETITAPGTANGTESIASATQPGAVMHILNGRLVLVFSGSAGAEYFVDRSSDLRVWNEFRAGRVVESGVLALDVGQVDSSAEFFRVRY